MASGERTGTVQDRVGEGTGAAIRQVYPPDAACDQRLDALIRRLEQIPSRRAERSDGH